MKKMIVSLVLMLMMLSFNVNAATLTLTEEDPDQSDLTNMGIVTGTGQLVMGASTLNGGTVNQIWGIQADPGDQNVVAFAIETSQATANIISVELYKDVGLTQLVVAAVLTPLNDYTFSALLTGGVKYFINVVASGTGSYTLNVQTPIPAAIWLFGSALMGLMGLSRRKGTGIGLTA